MRALNASHSRRPRGQVLALACLTFLLLALSLMASFSISHTIHERIRIQAAADAHAFTVATLEARGFNTLGYMNRAIAGGIVAELGLHAWYAIGHRDVSMYQAGFTSFIMVGVMELAQCPKFNIQHCIHAFQAFRIAMKYKQKENSAKSDLQSLDSKWRQAVTAYSDMIKDIYKDEKKLVKNLSSEVNGGSLLKTIADQTAPNAQSVNISYNKSFLACAVENTDIDGDCQETSWKKKGSSSSEHTKIMESAARAARPIFEAGRQAARSLSGGDYHTFPVAPMEGIDLPLPAITPKAMKDIQSEGTYIEMSVGKQNTTLDSNNISSSLPRGFVFVQWKHGVGFGVTNGSQGKGPYEGITCGGGNSGCFVSFRMANSGAGKSGGGGASDETDWGQPNTYGAYKQDLRTLGGGGKGNWEIDDTGTVKLPGSSDGELKYVAENDGYAVAKGKTYFHQLQDWNIPPNFFDPFWRAKLHPFSKQEIQDVLKKAGDSKGAQLISSGGAVEGVQK